MIVPTPGFKNSLSFPIYNSGMNVQVTQRFSLRGEIVFLALLTLWLQLYQFLLRSIFLYSHRDLATDIPPDVLTQAYINGFRFDLMITAWALAPLVIGLLFYHNSTSRKLWRFWLVSIAALITFLAVLEIDFYSEFHQRLNSLVLEYMQEDPKTVLSMVWFGFPVIRYLLLISALVLLFAFVVKHIDQVTRWPEHTEHTLLKHPLTRITVFLLALACTATEARGTFRQGPPLRWGDAFFSEFTFANHLGLNGTFTLAKAATSRANRKDDNSLWFKQLPEAEAMATLRGRWLLPDETLLDADKASLRRISTPAADAPKIRNVVIILMESFSGVYTGALGDTHGVTPAFDKLVANGLLFERFFSNGTHTHQGMFATLACFPNLPGHEYLMYQPEGAHHFSGIAKLLSQRDFNHTYVYNGSFSWDNQEGFFKNQGMKHFIGRESYINPRFSDETWGVSDEDMFDRALQELARMPTDKPFYAVLQTLSNHTPYSLPEPLPMEKILVDGQFSERLTAMRYADYALGRFFDEAQKAPYYDQTLFVLLGDHGFSVNKQLTAVDLLRFRVPMLLIGPGIVEHYGYRTDTVASQVDVLPTVMSLLGSPYQHQCWGRDVLNLPAGDNGIAVIKPSGNDPSVAIVSDEHILVRDPAGQKNLFRYAFKPDASVTSDNDTAKEASLWKLMQSYIQSAQIALKEDTTAP